MSGSDLFTQLQPSGDRALDLELGTAAHALIARSGESGAGRDRPSVRGSEEFSRQQLARISLEARLRRERVARGRAQLIPKRVGIRLHEALASHLSSRPRSKWREGIRESVREVLPSLTPAHRLALEARLVSLATRYLASYLPGDGVEFLGAEVFVEDVRLDLLWSSAGRLFADELKTGSAPLSAQMAIRQGRAQLAAGRVAFGDTFSGVRVVFLAEGRTVWVER